MKLKIIYIYFIIALFPVFTVGNVLENGKRISLSFESTPLSTVLNMISEQHNLNLVVSGDVKTEVSVRLENVDIATALDAILTANGFTYLIKEDVIVIKPTENIEAGDLISKAITLKYLKPITAQKALETRLSTKGKVVILDHTSESTGKSDYSANKILITDYPSIVPQLEATIANLDIKEQSILIEARIIETKIDNETRIGLNWPTSVTTKLNGADDGTSSTSSTSTILTNSNNNAGVHDLESGRWTWGKLSVAELQTVLDILEQNGNSRLVSNPRITTVENHQAEFKFETIIPIQTINRFTEGAATSDIVTFEDEEVGISLKVTPRINEAGTITLDVEPKIEDIIGFNGPPDNQKPITASRTIRTKITVENGETVALGGLIKEDEIENVSKVPLLGHIPILGSILFTHKSVEKSQTDLVIMITPHILK